MCTYIYVRMCGFFLFFVIDAILRERKNNRFLKINVSSREKKKREILLSSQNCPFNYAQLPYAWVSCDIVCARLRERAGDEWTTVRERGKTGRDREDEWTTAIRRGCLDEGTRDELQDRASLDSLRSGGAVSHWGPLVPGAFSPSLEHRATY